MELENFSEGRIREQPTPNNFDEYLPWACNQMQLDVSVIVYRTIQENTYATKQSATNKAQKKEAQDSEDRDSMKTQKKVSEELEDADDVVRINSIYDVNDDLLQIKISRNKRVPCGVLKIISLIVQFYPRLTTFTIDKGLNQDGVYTLSKLLEASKVTDIILDNLVIPQANYYILLDSTSFLSHLSLARCNLTDVVIEALVKRLLTSNLSILNLSSNKIRDEGGLALGNLLRTNRKLLYLNLAGNMITDIGADRILGSLMKFALVPSEIYEKKARHITYLRAKRLYEKTTKKNDKKRYSMTKPLPTRKNRIFDSDEHINTFESTLQDKAQIEATVEPFKDPFKPENTYIEDNTCYCLGNNTLSYLNLAYNNLTYFSVKKLYNVLRSQEKMKRQPRGLISVCIEGNNIPKNCIELTHINIILDTILSADRRSAQKDKKASKK